MQVTGDWQNADFPKPSNFMKIQRFKEKWMKGVGRMIYMKIGEEEFYWEPTSLSQHDRVDSVDFDTIGQRVSHFAKHLLHSGIFLLRLRGFARKYPVNRLPQRNFCRKTPNMRK